MARSTEWDERAWLLDDRLIESDDWNFFARSKR